MGTRVYRTPAPRPNRGRTFNKVFRELSPDEQFAHVAYAVIAPMLPRNMRGGDQVRAAYSAARLKVRMRELGITPDVKKP